MENIVRFLGVLIIVVVIMLILLVTSVTVHNTRSRSAEKKILSGKRDAKCIYDLLLTRFSKNRIITGAVLPIRAIDGSPSRAPSDIILVEHGGIFVIRVKNESGFVDDPQSGPWTVRNQNGIVPIPNPFDQNIPALRAINLLLKKEGITNIPCHSLVVFTGRRVTFKNMYEELLAASELLDALDDMNRNRFLDNREIKRVTEMINKYRLKRRPNPPKQG